MKTKKDNNAQRIIIAASIIVFVLLMIPFSYGAYVGYTMHSGINEDIEQSLKKHCDCDEVKRDHASFGIAISQEGVANETIAFYLNQYKTGSFEEEAIRLNELLKMEVANYNDVDLIQLHFKDVEGNEASTTIKNGIIQKK